MANESFGNYLVNAIFAAIGLLGSLATIYLAWRANKLPSVYFKAATFDPNPEPIKWWHIPVKATKIHFWQATVIRSCSVRMVLYGRDNGSKTERAMLWRTSQGPQREIDLPVNGPPGIVLIAVRHTIGQDWPIDPDPIRLHPIILRTNTAIFTDEDAMNERKFIPLPDDRIYTIQLALYCDGKRIAKSHIYFLYVPPIHRDNEGFRLFDYATHMDSI